MNKFYISISNGHTGNESKLKISGLYSSFKKIFTNFPKKNGGGGGQKRAQGFDMVFIFRVVEVEKKLKRGLRSGFRHRLINGPHLVIRKSM